MKVLVVALALAAVGCTRRGVEAEGVVSQRGLLLGDSQVSYGGLTADDAGGELVISPPTVLGKESAVDGSLRVWIEETGPAVLMKSKNGRGTIVIGFLDDGTPWIQGVKDGETVWQLDGSTPAQAAGP